MMSIKKILKEEIQNYMFFQNLKTIKSHVDMLLDKSPEELDSIISNGHDWAAEHITTAKDDIEEVCDFFTHGRGDLTEAVSENRDQLNVYNKLVNSGLVDPEFINEYPDYFEIYRIEGKDFEYFIDNWIRVEVNPNNKMINLTYEMYDEEEDYDDAEKVSYWLWEKLTDLFEGEYEVMDNI